MSTNSPNRPTGGWNLTSILNDIVTAWRLLWDPSVPSFLKLVLPIAAFVYFVLPDLIPGPLDDAAVLYLALYFFLRTAPPAAVQRARNNPPQPTSKDDNNTIDTTWRVVDDKNKH